MPRKKLRLKFIGNKKFLFNMLCFILSAAASTGLLVLTTNLLVLTKSDEFMYVAQSFKSNIIKQIILYSAVVIFVCIVISLFITIIYANKISGPLSRAKEYMYAMFQGNSQQPLLFRADDEFKDLTTVINAMQEKLQQTKKTALKRGKKRD